MSEETTAIHVHVWKPSDEFKYDDSDMLVDADLSVETVYADYEQYAVPVTIPPSYTSKTYNIEVRIPRRLSGDDHALYERYTYAATDRLVALREDRTSLTEQDVLNLYATFCDGSANAGVPPSLRDFGKWLAGTDEYDEAEPAEVVW